jgi:signal transduction histidine kinase
MIETTSLATDTGLEVTDISDDQAFRDRKPHVHDAAVQMEGMRRIARAFVENSESMLQELVQVAVELCGADSAGISIEKEDRTDSSFYHWVATAGEYSEFFNATLPRFPSACGICLERERPQRFRVHQRFFDIMGISAPLVTDGLLLPWHAGHTRGTIFVMAHGRQEAFDFDDYRLMQLLADFAAMGVRQQTQHKLLLEQQAAAAAAAMANELAHRINNPLQSLTNILYLASSSGGESDTQELLDQACGDLERLSSLVSQLLRLPVREFKLGSEP